MTIKEIGKVWEDWITVRTYTLPLPCVGIYYADTARQGHEYLMPPDEVRKLAVMLMEAADALEGVPDEDDRSEKDCMWED